MLCSRFLKNEHEAGTAASTCSLERGFDAMLERLRARRSTWCCGHQSSRCASSSLTLALTVVPLRRHPDGLLPAAGHRLHLRRRRSRAGRLVRQAMNRRKIERRRRRAPGSRRRPASAMFGGSAQLNQANLFIGLKPKDEGRNAQRRPDHRRGCGRSWRQVEGVQRCSCRRRRTSTSAAALARTQYQYTLTDADLDELNDWAPQAAGARCRSCRS